MRHDVKNDVMSLVFIHNCKNVCFYLIKYSSLLKCVHNEIFLCMIEQSNEMKDQKLNISSYLYSCIKS